LNRSLLCVVWACRAPHTQGDRSSSVAAAFPPGNQTRQYNNRRPPASSTLPASPLTGSLAEPPCKSTMQRDAGAAPPRPARPRSPARQPPAGRPCRPRTGERAPGRAQRQRCCRHAAAAASLAPAPAPARSGSSSRENAYCAGGTAYSCPGVHARLSRARLRGPHRARLSRARPCMHQPKASILSTHMNTGVAARKHGRGAWPRGRPRRARPSGRAPCAGWATRSRRRRRPYAGGPSARAYARPPSARSRAWPP